MVNVWVVGEQMGNEDDWMVDAWIQGGWIMDSGW